jgi:SAM-dependent methyltransferase
MSMREVYRTLADTYARFSVDNPVNAHYDRPNIIRLAGDLQGKRVLELGCAAGLLTEQLADRRADVLAVDREPRLVAHASDRLAGRAQVEVVDLEEPFGDILTGSVEVVVASLVLHYIEDWGPLLAELHRVLVPGGVLVFSVHHPITGWNRSEGTGWNRSEGTDYHRTELVNEEWDWDGESVAATMFRRPFSAIFGGLRAAGFAVDVVDEPFPHNLPHDMDARMRVALTTTPVFLFVRALRDPTS